VTSRRNRASEAALGPFGSSREITSITPGGRWLTDYEVAICQAQSDLGHFDTGGWYVLRRDGAGIYAEDSTKVAHPDWFEFRDPSNLWQKTYVSLQAEEEAGLARNRRSAQDNQGYQDIDPHWCREVLAPYYEAYACCEAGLSIALSRCVREALSDTVSMALVMASVDRSRHQQDIAAVSLALVQDIPTYVDGLGPEVWTYDPVMAPVRLVVERILDTPDWVEIAFVVALLFDPLVANLFLSRFLRRFAPANGDLLTPFVVTSVERDRARFRDAVGELVRMLLAEQSKAGDKVPHLANRAVMQGWLDDWAGDVVAAMDALRPLFVLPRVRPDTADACRASVVTSCQAMIGALGLEVPAPLGP
jgi:methane monooxygenase component A beta chain/propane monooxygenase small subunit